MALAIFKSTNPNFSFLINKNPENPIRILKYKKGAIYGLWLNSESYVTYFRDGDDEVTFKGNDMNEDYDFDYNNVERYNSPLSYVVFIREFLSSNIRNNKGDKVYDSVDYENEITINQVFLYSTKYITLFQEYFKDITFKCEEIAGTKRNYKLTISNKGSFNELISIIYILFILYYTNTNKPFITTSDVKKYCKVMNNFVCPYFIKYVFKSNVITSSTLFKEVRDELNFNKLGEKWNMVIGNTHTQRSNFIIDEMITDDRNVIDIGCGDMTSYGFTINNRVHKNDKSYIAIDIDTDLTKILEKKKEARNLQNFYIYNDVTNALIDTYEDEVYDVIMSEIFEHVPLELSTQWFKQIISEVNFKKIVVTTPNKDFNINYDMSEELRLDEHEFEMTSEEFQNHFNNLFGSNDNIVLEYVNIGDEVNGLTPTQCVIIFSKTNL